MFETVVTKAAAEEAGAGHPQDSALSMYSFVFLDASDRTGLPNSLSAARIGPGWFLPVPSTGKNILVKGQRTGGLNFE